MTPPPRHLGVRSWRVLARLTGVLILGVVVATTIHATEARAFLQLAENAEPWWLAVALALQALTYSAQGEILRAVVRAAGQQLPLGVAWRLSLVKLFADQAAPSAGISGALVVERELGRRGLAHGVVRASVVINIATYYAVYVVSLAAALTVALLHGRVPELVLLASLAFAGVGALLAVGTLTVSGRGRRALPRWLQRIRPLRAASQALAAADAGLVHDRALLLRTSFFQLLIVLADAATMYVLIHAVGAKAPITAVFASFVLASACRTIAILPGGFGVFEAASVLTLRLAGLTLPVALAATLLFRGLSFWLPMLPGAWWMRRTFGPATRGVLDAHPPAFWSRPVEEVLATLSTTTDGLTTEEATKRLLRHGTNEVSSRKRRSRFTILLGQLRNPLLLILALAAIVAAANGEWINAAIVLAIVGASIGVGYRREYDAESAVAMLRARIGSRARVLRDGHSVEVALESVVPGDVTLLAAGSLVPADGLILEASDCFVSEAALTGEAFPVEKRPGVSAADAPLTARTNAVFLGSNVRSGSAHCLIVATGPATAFAAIAGRLGEQPPETEFDRGLRRFSYLLTGTMLALVTVVFAVHVLNGRPVLDTLLFAVALAVGLSPELLPAILSINLARGASLMAKEGVLVRHLSAIENLGSMDVLCTDKTGTLTEGVVELSGAFDATGVDSPEVLELASWNAALATGLVSPLDEALLSTHRPTTAGLRKIAELPFDFERKRVSVLVEDGIGQRLVTKGAFEPILSVCTQLAGGTPLDSSARSALRAQFEAWSRDGIRVVAVAERRLSVGEVLERGAEHDLAFRGFLTFLDRPKKGVREAIADLAHLGVTVKVISGDNLLVTRHIAGMVGLSVDTALTGRELATMDDITLAGRLEAADIFAEVDPGQKERIIGALRRRGHVVGFLGDGVNDAPAMHAADTSLSVQTAVDVAREAADFVLLEQDLDVIRAGIEEGRRTVANTLKYIRATMSANLGNMLSMAAASLILPFLPLLASQILLNNFLSDIPAFGIAEDSVDPELVETPPRWDVAALGRFMLVFGLVSSAFDFLTFGVLLRLFHAGPALFRTGWFVESLLTELAVALIVRTRRPFYQSRPGALLFGASVVLMVVTFAIPYLPLSQLIGFTPLPAPLVLVIVAITLLYVMATEGTKRLYYARGKA